MKTTLFITIISVFALGCSEEDNPKTHASGFIILNRYENKANIDGFEYPSKNIQNQLFTVASNTSLHGAAKNGNNIYLHTNYPGKLRKIDLENQTQIVEVDSWFENFPFIDFNEAEIVVCHLGYDNNGIIKVYNQNLDLQDSIAIPNVMNIYDAVVSNNKLFFSATILEEGTFIQVMDLSSLTITSSIELESNSCLFSRLEDKHLLVIERNRYYMLDATTLEVSNVIPSTFGHTVSRGNFDFSKSENSLYALTAAAQPAPVAYVLKKINLATGETLTLTDFSVNVNGPMVYDNDNKVIICGVGSDGAGLQVISQNGQQLHETELPIVYLFKK